MPYGYDQNEDPDYQAFQTPMQVENRRAMAKALLENAFSTPEGHSGHFTAVSPFAPLTQGLSALVGSRLMKQSGDADKQSSFIARQSASPPNVIDAEGAARSSDAGTGSPSAYADPTKNAQQKTAAPANDFMARARGATGGQESGGDYHQVGPMMLHGPYAGDHAYGKYQVMGKNIPEWTQEALGYQMTPQQFLMSREAQDAVYNHKFGQYVSKYGPEGAARAWYGGPGNVNNPGARDLSHPNAPNVGQYSQEFMRRLAAGQPQSTGLPPGAMAFSGEPQNAPAQTPQDQNVAQTVMALSGRGGAHGAGSAGPSLNTPTGGIVGEGVPESLAPQQVPVTRKNLIWSQGPYIRPEMADMVRQGYYQQGQPIETVNDLGQKVIINPRTHEQRVINPPEWKDIKVKGIETPTPFRLNPDGSYSQMPIGAGGAKAAPAAAEPEDDTPSLKFAPEGKPEAAGEELPPEISKGPEAAKAEKAGMLGTKPPTTGVALPFDKVAETKLPSAPSGSDLMSMTPEQKFKWVQGQEIGQKATEHMNQKNIDDSMKGNQEVQKVAIQAAGNKTYVDLADKLIQDPRLQALVGPGANVKMGWNDFLAFLGNKDANLASGLRDTFEKLISSNIIGALRSDYGGLGQIRNKEIELSQKATFSPNNTVEANMALLEIAKRTIARQEIIGKISNAYMEGKRWDKDGNPIKGTSDKIPTYSELSGVINKYLNNHPLFDDTKKGADGKTEMDHYLGLFKGAEKTKETAPLKPDVTITKELGGIPEDVRRAELEKRKANRPAEGK